MYLDDCGELKLMVGIKLECSIFTAAMENEVHIYVHIFDACNTETVFAKRNVMLDGFTIIERGTNRIVFARQSPTLLATLSNEFKETKRDSVDAKRPQMSSVLAAAYLPKNQTHSIDYVNKNIVWAETIIAYMNRVQHGSVPSLDGEFRVFSYSNDRMIVFTAINALLFIVVGDSDSGELGCKNI